MPVTTQPLHEVHDLTSSGRNLVFNMTLAEAEAIVASGDPDRIRTIEGHFAITARCGHIVRMARSLQLPLRYFIAKREAGPALVVAERIDAIRAWLDERGLGDQFHPSYTRMVPAHHLTEIALVGCPDPNPVHRRFFDPPRGTLPPDPETIGKAYIGALAEGLRAWLRLLGRDEPIGVCFSGGIDSGAVLLVTHRVMLEEGMHPGRLKAFSLVIDGASEDLAQARSFLEATDLDYLLEPIEVPMSWIDRDETVRVLEDYKPLDVQAGAMMLALCRGIRERHPAWRHLLDGDGGDENLKDYPIEENPELTIRSVLNNRMLYQEGWGVDSIKHSMTYSGGLSRGCTRGYAPTTRYGFRAFSPFMLPSVIAVAEAIPFVELTGWRHDRLYALKGEIVSKGVEAVTGCIMPVHPKRRFQHGVMTPETLADRLPEDPADNRRAFHAAFGP